MQIRRYHPSSQLFSPGSWTYHVLPPGSVSSCIRHEHEARYLRCKRAPFSPQSKTTSLYPQSFPFSQLPVELRLDILEFYALPQGPVIYRLGYSEQWCLYGNDRLREFWSLRQVNREARQAVMRGRQIVREYRCLPRGTRRSNVKVLCFPAWDRDLFVLNDCIGPDPMIEPHVQYLGCPLMFFRNPNTEYRSFAISHFSAGYVLHEVVAKLPALRCIYFIMTHDNYMTGEDDPPRFPDSREGIQMRARDGDAYGHLPVSLETLKLYFAKYTDNSEWRPELMRRLNRFRNEWQVCMFMACGRKIDCKVVV
ncbi:hypothetical protein F5B21DRAFT_361319 [Xylaria acuta]|nr:hypothetical protein F5B21DRAFT_361319 [Xylaria acuta]